MTFLTLNGLEKKTALLKAMLRSYEQVRASIAETKQFQSREEKGYIFDLLGLKEEMQSAKDNIVSSAKKNELTRIHLQSTSLTKRMERE